MAKYNKSSVKKANVDSASRAAMAMGSQSKKEKLSLKEYFKGVKLEMKKVVWPTKKELGSYDVCIGYVRILHFAFLCCRYRDFIRNEKASGYRFIKEVCQ